MVISLQDHSKEIISYKKDLWLRKVDFKRVVVDYNKINTNIMLNEFGYIPKSSFREGMQKILANI